MRTSEPLAGRSGDLGRGIRRAQHERTSTWLTGGGTDGNERLTAITGLILIVLLAAIGVTILRIGQLTWLHLFLGLLLIGPVVLKMASTGYRFARYYVGDPIYREKGPPQIVLRATAPIVVLSTIAVFVTGVVLMFEGPAHRHPLLLIHKVSFIVWIAFTALHVLGHLPEMSRSLRAGATADRISAVPGNAGRSIALGGALVGGLVLAIVLIPDFGIWTHHAAGLHRH
jgi:hypothetical protein